MVDSMDQKLYEEYPLWMVLVYNIAVLLLYLAGSYILFRLNLITGLLYLVFILFIERSVYREGCRHCFYYGKRCVAGKGSLAPLFVKKGDPKKFCERELTFKDFIPQMLVGLIPLVVGIALLISRGYHLLTLLALLYPLLSWFALNPLLYGKLGCPHCRQGSICCPAMKFFSKGNKK